MNMNISIYTDGACSGNPGPGGYAYVILTYNKVNIKANGFKKETTNNEMELLAICKSLKVANTKLITENTEIKLYSDSAYCLNAINEKWLFNWQKQDWKTKAGKEIKNKLIWQEIYEIITNTKAKIEFIKVKGHSGNEYNELVDKLAKDAIRKGLGLNGRTSTWGKLK